jgi:hypothetical protein
MHGCIKALLASLGCVIATYSGAATAAASLYLDGMAAQSGSSSEIWPLRATYTATTDYRAAITVQREPGKIEATLTAGASTRVFTLGMSTANGAALVPGLYAGAVQSGGDGALHLPSLSATGQSFGCINSIGWFRVIEADFAADGSVTRLAAEFLTWCDGVDSPLFGAIRIDSNVPVPSRDTYAVAGRRISADQGQSVSLDASYSASLTNAPLSYAWTQTSGPAVQLSGANTATPSFVAPNVTPGGQALTFQLTATGAPADVDTDTVTVLVHHPSDPQTRALFISPIGAPKLEVFRRYYAPFPQNEDVKDLRYVFNGDDWKFVAKMRGSHNLFVKWQGAFPVLRGNPSLHNFEHQLDLELQRGLLVPLTAGRYEGIQYFDANSAERPYMRFSAPEGGCDMVGAFDIREIEFAPPPVNDEAEVTKLAVDFEHRCFVGSQVSVPMRGSIRINSAIPLSDDLVPPLPPPAPTSVRFTVSTNPVVVNQETTLSWSSTNADFCYGFNGFDNVAVRGPLPPSGSIKQAFVVVENYEPFVTCYTSNSLNTDVKTVQVVAATSGGGSNPPAGGGSSGGSSSGGGGGGAIDGILLALATAVCSYRRLKSQLTIRRTSSTSSPPVASF